MSLKMKSHKVSGTREERMSPFHTPKRNNSPKSWSPPQQDWQSRNASASQNTQSPQHYNSCSSPNGYLGYPQHGSPNQWDPTSNYPRNSACTPRTPRLSPIYMQSPEHGSVYPEWNAQVPCRRIASDINDYYNPSMLEDPWAELEAKATESAVST